MDSLINGGNSSSSSSSSLDNLKPSVLVIILILLMTLLISVSICFLLRCLNRCNHRLLLPPSSISSTSSDSRRFSGHRVSPETEISISSVLDSLPLFKFSSVNRRSTSSNSGDCAVCLSKFESEDQLRLLPLCCHAFHADCIDTWLISNQTCPLCRSPLFASDSDLIKSLHNPSSIVNNGDEIAGDNSFRLQIGSISRRNQPISNPDSVDQNRSYSMGSFDYIVDDVESEISESNFHRRSSSGKQEDSTTAVTVTVTSPSSFESNLAADIGNEGSRSWLKDYVDRLSRGISSRAISFRGSGRFFTGSSRRSEELTVADLEANHSGEEISELFRWLSGM